VYIRVKSLSPRLPNEMFQLHQFIIYFQMSLLIVPGINRCEFAVQSDHRVTHCLPNSFTLSSGQTFTRRALDNCATAHRKTPSLLDHSLLYAQWILRRSNLLILGKRSIKQKAVLTDRLVTLLVALKLNQFLSKWCSDFVIKTRCV